MYISPYSSNSVNPLLYSGSQSLGNNSTSAAGDAEDFSQNLAAYTESVPSATGGQVETSSTSTTSGASSSSSANSTSSASNPGELSSTDFMDLLVAQLQNQDPTNPVDPTTFVDQLVDFNSLEQLIDINQDLSSGSSASTSNGNTSAASSGSTTATTGIS